MGLSGARKFWFFSAQPVTPVRSHPWHGPLEWLLEGHDGPGRHQALQRGKGQVWFFGLISSLHTGLLPFKIAFFSYRLIALSRRLLVSYRLIALSSLLVSYRLIALSCLLIHLTGSLPYQAYQHISQAHCLYSQDGNVIALSKTRSDIFLFETNWGSYGFCWDMWHIQYTWPSSSAVYLAN